jgi:hypothetical protein
MTVSSTTNKVVYAGDGVASVFDFTFKVFEAADLTVTRYTIADGTEVVLTLTTDYTVDVGNGQVTLVAGALAATYKLIIQRVLPLTQEADYVENDPFPAETHEEVADRAVMITQQLKEAVDRSLKVDATQIGVSLTLPIPEASKLVGWNASADGLENYTPNEETYLTQATQAEAEAGTNNTSFMTPLRSVQSQKLTAVALAIATGAVATDASLGTVFTLTADDNFTLSNPTNAYNGQKLIWRIKQDAVGSRVITLGNKFTVATEVGTVVLSTAADSVDYLGAIYSATADKFEVVAFAMEQA